MALQVWLPLLGNLNQQGIADVTITNYGATVDNVGKIGKCYKFDGTDDRIQITNLPNPKNVTVAFWMKRGATTNTRQFMFTAWGGVTCEFATNNTLHCYVNGGNGACDSSTAITVDTGWVHVVYSFEDCVGGKLYINGSLHKSTASTGSISWTTTTGNIGNFSNMYYNGYINDFRFYDHALSPREVAEIAKGLVLHYPLSENITVMNNAYSYPTFDTNNAGGGWSHWGGSGHIGTYGQSTDKNYIFRPNQTYCHWVANGAGATYNYLLYQSPDYEGGYRSVQCICKEENGIEITNDVVYAAWNNRSGGVPNNSWTSITPLGNGFYWCKAEGVMQDGNNDLIGFCVKPGYKVYFSEAYLENGKEICSDPFLTDRTTIYDTSGFGNNGTMVSGSLSSSSDSARYSLSTYFNGSSYFTATSLPSETKAISFWIKATIPSGSAVAFADYGSKIAFGFFGGNSLIVHCGSSNGSTGSRVLLGTNIWKTDDWNHVVIIKTGTGTYTTYLNNTVLTPDSVNYWNHNSDNFMIGGRSSGSYITGYLSDLRAYATPLTENQVKELYNTPVSLADNGSLITYGEFVEQ